MTWTDDELNRYSANLARALSKGDEKFRWTGWKNSEKDPGEYVGQWCDWHDPEYFYYVNVPSMNHGPYKRGENFDIGNERITLETPESVVAAHIRNGFGILLVNRGYSTTSDVPEVIEWRKS